jgi:hypothetical protein
MTTTFIFSALYLAHVPNVNLKLVICAAVFDVVRHIYNHERMLSFYFDMGRPNHEP